MFHSQQDATVVELASQQSTAPDQAVGV